MKSLTFLIDTLSHSHTVLIKMHEIHKVSLLGSDEVLVFEKRQCVSNKERLA